MTQNEKFRALLNEARDELFIVRGKSSLLERIDAALSEPVEDTSLTWERMVKAQEEAAYYRKALEAIVSGSVWNSVETAGFALQWRSNEQH